MDDNLRYIPWSDRSPLVQLIISLLIMLGLGTLLMIISMLAGTAIFGVDPEFIEDLSGASTKNEIAFLRFILLSQAICIFIVPAVLILIWFSPVQGEGLTIFKIPGIGDTGLVVLLAFSLIPITSYAGQLNSMLDLPDWLSAVERWITGKEDEIGQLFDLIIVSGSFSVMVGNLFLIAILPALGEELIFRGVFQRLFARIFRSGHLAIWVTAFIFSAIHLQFFGFVPRLILGVVFGYLFYWSGTIWLPIAAHFLNNAVPVIGAYINGWDGQSITPEYPLWRELIALPVPIVISVVILLYFRNGYRKKSEDAGNTQQVEES
jgi:hypothetical protein